MCCLIPSILKYLQIFNETPGEYAALNSNIIFSERVKALKIAILSLHYARVSVLRMLGVISIRMQRATTPGPTKLCQVNLE